jgi:hypothetical protein
LQDLAIFTAFDGTNHARFSLKAAIVVTLRGNFYHVGRK